MKRFLKPLLVGVSLLAALFLTLTRRGADGGIGVATPKPLSAAPGRTPRNYDLTALKVFNVALVRVKDNYVDPQRLKPKKMLVSALDAVEKTVAEVLVEDKKKNRLLVKVDSFQKEFNIDDVDSPWSLSSRMKQVLRFVQAHLLEGTKIRDVEYAAINGMLSTLDPHSVVLKPEAYNEMKLTTRGQFGGLGIVISMVKGVLTVINPMKGTPAEQAGIKACDQILKIGEESTVNMTLTQAVNRLRGTPGSKVEITIMRAGWTRSVRKVLTRARIKVPSVKGRLLKNKVGYVRLQSFQGNSLDDMRGQLETLKRKGMKALIIDLRGNPGGLLEQAIKVSDLFIESGTLVTTVSFAGKKREEKRARASGTEPRYPIAVLVDSGSASASEIVAGALKNLDRAVIIGNRTFGKGTVQVLYDNDDGSALKLTIAEYLTPGDVSIQAVGITPDIVTSPVFVRKDFIQLKRSDDSRREKDLDRHLIHSKTTAKGKPYRTLHYLFDDDEKENKKSKKDEKKKQKNLCLYPDRECKPEEDDKFVEDFQVQVARDLLARAHSWRRSQILAGAGGFFTRRQAQEERRVAEEMKKLNVDWSRSAASGKPSLKVSVTTDPAQFKAMACRKMSIRVTVKNEGTTATSQLTAVSKSSNELFNGHEFVFGRIEPGATKSWEVPVSIRDAPTRVDDVTFKFEEQHGNVPPPKTVQFSTKGMARPTFAYAYQLIDDIKGNLDGRPQRGEQLRLFVKVKNTGTGAAYRTITSLKNLSGVGIFIRKGRFVLGKLAPGETRSASFTLDVQNSFSMDKFKVELAVYDDALRESVSEKLRFRITQTEHTPQTATGNVRISSARASFRAWPGDDAPLVGTAPRGAGFRVVGRSTGWYRVIASKRRPAFVAATDVTPGGTVTKGKFKPLWQVTPPQIRIKVPAYATTANQIRIEGVATDEKRVQDLYVFVRNPDAKVHARKVFYTSNRSTTHPKELRFSTNVPLWPGANYVSIHARENEDVQAKEMVVIFRKKAMAVAAEGKNKPKKSR